VRSIRSGVRRCARCPSYTFAEATRSQETARLAGLPPPLLRLPSAGCRRSGWPDNLRSAVSPRDHRSQPDINPSLRRPGRALRGGGLVPGAARKARDKAQSTRLRVAGGLSADTRRPAQPSASSRWMNSTGHRGVCWSDSIKATVPQTAGLPAIGLRQALDHPALAAPEQPYVYAEWKKARCTRLPTSSSMCITDSVPYQTGEEASGGARLTAPVRECFHPTSEAPATRASMHKGPAPARKPRHMPRVTVSTPSGTPQRLHRLGRTDRAKHRRT